MKMQRRKVNEEIPTASMADIAFLLIIYFMLTATFAATRGLDFAFPEEEEDPPMIEREESILIEIRPDRSLEVDGRPMRLEEIFDYMRPHLEANPRKPVIIRPDPSAPYGEMVRVFDYLRRGPEIAGLEVRNIAIPTEREIQTFWY